jgi:hypothetical protein
VIEHCSSGSSDPGPPEGACSLLTARSSRIALGTLIPKPLFPNDGRRNAERQALEFGVEIGECRGVVLVPLGGAKGPLGPSAPPPRLRRGLLPPADPVREHRRAEAPSAPVDRACNVKMIWRRDLR